MMNLDEWNSGAICDEDNLPFCSRCKPNDLPTLVFMTSGSGAAFHATPECEALLSGLRAVERSGGEPTDPRPTTPAIALGSGRLPCLICLPGHRDN
jgi:hypothetical protein